MLDKEKGEFNFNMHETENFKIQLQARYEGTDSNAIKGLAYNYAIEKKLSHNQRKRINKIMRQTTEVFADKLRIQDLGVLVDYG